MFCGPVVFGTSMSPAGVNVRRVGFDSGLPFAAVFWNQTDTAKPFAGSTCRMRWLPKSFE